MKYNKNVKNNEAGKTCFVIFRFKLKGEKMEKLKIIGTFKNNKSFGFVVPDDKKQSHDIFISKRNFGHKR